MSDAPSLPASSWHTDPLTGTPRLRWWSGNHWTAWVVTSAVETPSIAWTPALGDLPPPICWGTAVLRVAIAPRLRIAPPLRVEALVVPSDAPALPSVPDAPPLAVPDAPPLDGPRVGAASASGDGARTDGSEPAAEPGRRPGWRRVLVAAAIVVVVGLVAAASVLLLSGHGSGRRHAAAPPRSSRSVAAAW